MSYLAVYFTIIKVCTYLSSAPCIPSGISRILNLISILVIQNSNQKTKNSLTCPVQYGGWTIKIMQYDKFSYFYQSIQQTLIE